MKNIYTFVVAGLLGLTVLQSCADDPVTPSQDETDITFTQGAEAKFNYTRLDSAAATENQPMADGRDTVIQITFDTTASYEGTTAVVKNQNRYVIGGEKDTSYLWQDANGDLYIHNFGLDLVNSASVQAIINQPISAGWVLVAKMGASSGASWIGLRDTVNLINFFNVQTEIIDNVTANGEMDFTLNGAMIKVKKFTHSVVAKTPLGNAAEAIIEIYVSREHGGIVHTVRKAASITLPGQTPFKAIGAETKLVSYVK